MPTKSSSTPERVHVIIPDLFQSFLKDEPLVNTNLGSARLESEQWLGDFCSFSPKMRMKIHRCNFSYFCAVAAPHAARAEFNTICDWGNWVFPYDDMFDNGDLKDRPAAARGVMNSLMSTMLGEDDCRPKLKLVEFHDRVFQAIAEKTSEGVQSRFARAMNAYCQGTLAQVEGFAAGRTPSLEEMLQTRRLSSGVSPLYHLVEFGHEIRLPGAVFDDPVLQELQDLGIDFVSIVNDILSYLKEEVEGVPHNMVAICRMGGMPAQQAFDTVGQLFYDRLARWDNAISRLPSWSTTIDSELQRYIQGIMDVVKANLHWSFQSERYLGTYAAEVRATRTISVLATPSFMYKLVGGTTSKEVWSESLTQTSNDDEITPRTRTHRCKELSWRLHVAIISALFSLVIWKYLLQTL